MSCCSNLCYRFRLNGIRSAKSILATTVDIAGDWFYYFSIRNNNGDNGEVLNKYEDYLFAFCIVGSGVSGMFLLSLLMNYWCCPSNYRNRSMINALYNKFAPFGICLKTALLLQILFQDIPHLVLTLLISKELGSLSNFAVFNFTTSGMNIMLNLLDMIEIEDDVENQTKIIDKKRRKTEDTMEVHTTDYVRV